MAHPLETARPLPPDIGIEGRITRQLHREVVLLAGWGRAILLQLAHPLVAQGVFDHSTFADTRWGRAIRLRHTLRAMLALTFGTPVDAAAAVDGINRIHDRVHGRLAETAGSLSTGAPYSAHDPALLLWVHATLVDTFLITYERFVAPLTSEEKDRYCLEAAAGAPRLGIPIESIPDCEAALAHYMERMLASGDIAVTDTARQLATDVLSLGLPGVAQPIVAIARLPVVGMLPETIRTAYGFRWTPRHERALAIVASMTRRTLPALPSLLRHWPGAPQAHDLVTRLGAGRFGRSAVCGSEIGELGERRRGRPGAENRRELVLVTDGTMLGAKLDDRLGFPRPDSGKLLQLEWIGQIDAHLGGHGSPPSPEGVPGVSLGRGSRRLAAPRRGRRTAL